MARLFAAGLKDRIGPLGIVPGQFPVLIELWESDGKTQRELVEKLEIEQPTLANTLARMERDGLIRRAKHPSDARSKLIYLTERGTSLKDDAFRAAVEQNEEALSRLSPAEQDQFRHLMRTVIDTMREQRR